MTDMSDEALLGAPLGQETTYPTAYDAGILFAIDRQLARRAIGLASTALPFHGYDLWTAYEVSWLNPKGKPVLAIAEITVPCQSTAIVESKSLKLYLNTFNQTQFVSSSVVAATIAQDLSRLLGAQVTVDLYDEFDPYLQAPFMKPVGTNLDTLDVACQVYQPCADLLQVQSAQSGHQTYYSGLLKSNCRVTGQPDWGSVFITCEGPQIDPASLLRYIVSFRDHNEFHEPCVERIFVDILAKCAPSQLQVAARYTRRGGIDINPVRRTDAKISLPPRQPRQ